MKMNDGLKEKIDKAIERLKAFEPNDEPYYLCYSGGKDSDCIRILADLANVKHDIVHNLTTVDAPETIQYIKSIPNVIINQARYNDGTPKTMWNLIVKKHMPPTRMVRYCCAHLKEWGGKGRMKITGVRWAESAKRKNNKALINIIGKPKTVVKTADTIGVDYLTNKYNGLMTNNDNDESRKLVEFCYKKTNTTINPIIDWTDDEVWDFLHYYGCESNPLYKKNDCNRIGCIGCPLSTKKNILKEFELYPKYKYNYIRAFDRMLKNMNRQTDWKTGQDVFDWWVGDLKIKKDNEPQLILPNSKE